DEGRKAERSGDTSLEKCEAESSALRGEPDVAGRERPWRKRRVECCLRDGEPQTIGPQEPSSMPPHELEQLFLARLPLRPDLGKAGRDDTESPTAPGEYRLRAVEHDGGRKADDCEIDPGGNLLDCAMRLRPCDA